MRTALLLALLASSPAWAGSPCGCKCPMGKTAFKRRAPAAAAPMARSVQAQSGEALVRTLERV